MGYRIAVVGTGAVGGFYGAMLQKAGHEVHFLLHRDFQTVAANGLVVDSCLGDFTLPNVLAYDDAKKIPPCDLVIVALKVTANGMLAETLPTMVKSDGVVLTLQNGMGADDQIAQIVGPERVMGGLCFICSNKVGPGHIRHLDYGAVTLGEYAEGFGKRGLTERLRFVTNLFSQAGVPATAVEDLFLARWKKLVWNIPYNGMSVILNATTDRMVRDPILRPLFQELMEEVAQGAAGFGRVIDPAFIEQMIAYTDKMTPYATSMMLDFQNGRKMEVEAIYGEPLRLAASRDVHLPRIETLYRQLSFINAQRS